METWKQSEDPFARDLMKITANKVKNNPDIPYDKAGRGQSGLTRTKIRVMQK